MAPHPVKVHLDALHGTEVVSLQVTVGNPVTPAVNEIAKDASGNIAIKDYSGVKSQSSLALLCNLSLGDHLVCMH
jgi:hydrogenase maturation factor